MSKAGKKIMQKKEREAMQSRVASSLPKSILRPDYPAAARETPKEGSGSNSQCQSSSPEDKPSSEITINGVPIVYESTPNGEANVCKEMMEVRSKERESIPAGTRLRVDGTLEPIVEGRTPEECSQLDSEFVLNNASWFSEEQVAQAKARKIELQQEWQNAPYVGPVDLDKWADDGGAVGVDPGAPEGDMSDTVIVEKSRQVGCSQLPPFDGRKREFTRERLIESLRIARDKTVFISPAPGPEAGGYAIKGSVKFPIVETPQGLKAIDSTGVPLSVPSDVFDGYIPKEETDGEETPELAQVHEGATQGSGAETGLGDEERCVSGSENIQGDAEQMD